MSLLHGQAAVSAMTPMPTDRVDDSSLVGTSTSEAVVWYYVTSSAWAAAATQAAGTLVTAKLTYTGVLNQMASGIGTNNDTGLSFAAATRAAQLKNVPDAVFNELAIQSPTTQSTEMAKYLTTAGDYCIDHRRGQVWLNSKAQVANDSATYSYQTPVSVTVTTSGTSTVYSEDVATPSIISGPTVMMERDDALSTLTPAAADWAAARCSAEGALWTQDFNSDAIKASVEIMDDWDTTAYTETLALASNNAKVSALCYGGDWNNGTPILAAFQVAVDNTTISATPNTLVVGGIYKAALDTYDDNDAVPIHFDNKGQLAVGIAHSGVDAGYPLKIGGIARSSQNTAVTALDRTDAVFNLNGEQVIAGYDWATQSNSVTERDPIDEHYVEEELVDTTNVGTGTNYYPSSTGRALGSYNNVSIHAVTSGGVTATIEAKIDDSTDWVDITPAGYRLDDNTTGNASFVDQTFMLDFDNLHVRHVRIKSVTSDATNGVQYHWKLTAL
jgi:hypothetical protein